MLAAALASQPDWLLSLNRKHFTDQLAGRTGLRIATPLEFFRSLH